MKSAFPDLIFPDWEAPDNVRAFSTVRYGGVSLPPYHGRDISDGGLNFAMHVGDLEARVEANRAALAKMLPSEPLWLDQVHGTAVVSVADSPLLPQADASFAIRPEDVCIVLTADCLPVLLCDVKGEVVAAVHAGWRGLAGGILESTLFAMRAAQAGEILAWLGPAIGPGHFEVGEDVPEFFEARYGSFVRDEAFFLPVEHAKGKYLADIYALARVILEKNQVLRISGGGFCTVREESRFYSFRRDGITGRMATCIWRKRQGRMGALDRGASVQACLQSFVQLPA